MTPEISQTEVETTSSLLVQAARNLIIEDREDAEQAGTMLVNVSTAAKTVEEFFAPSIKAAHDAHRQMIETRNRILSPLVEARDDLKLRLAAYQEVQDAQQRAQLAARLSQAGPENLPAVLPVPDAPLKGLTKRTRWTFEITDESRIPREFMQPDRQKLADYARMMREKASVQGVRFFSKRGIAVRGK